MKPRIIKTWASTVPNKVDEVPLTQEDGFTNSVIVPIIEQCNLSEAMLDILVEKYSINIVSRDQALFVIKSWLSLIVPELGAQAIQDLNDNIGIDSALSELSLYVDDTVIRSGVLVRGTNLVIQLIGDKSYANK